MDYQEALKKHEKDCCRCREKICKYAIKKFSCLQEIDIKAYKELMSYRQIGTPEEVLEAVERQHAKKPSLMLGIYGRVYECKECGNELEMYSKYCPFCGQKQNWE